jgi:hypothetical protein
VFLVANQRRKPGIGFIPSSWNYLVVTRSSFKFFQKINVHWTPFKMMNG